MKVTVTRPMAGGEGWHRGGRTVRSGDSHTQRQAYKVTSPIGSTLKASPETKKPHLVSQVNSFDLWGKNTKKWSPKVSHSPSHNSTNTHILGVTQRPTITGRDFKYRSSLHRQKALPRGAQAQNRATTVTYRSPHLSIQ